MNPPDEPPGEPAGPSFARSTAVMSVGTALSRLTGFLRVIAMLYALGVGESRLADAYNVANTTPNIIYELALGGILSSVFIPVFVEWLETRSREEAWHSARAVLSSPQPNVSSRKPTARGRFPGAWKREPAAAGPCRRRSPGW